MFLLGRDSRASGDWTGARISEAGRKSLGVEDRVCTRRVGKGDVFFAQENDCCDQN